MIQYYLWFQTFTGDLGTHSPQIRGLIIYYGSNPGYVIFLQQYFLVGDSIGEGELGF